jgi:hypothetical protein
MPEEITTSTEPTTPAEEIPSPAPVIKPIPEPEVKFTLEKIDDENVRKITSHPDVAIVNIPSMTKAKDDLESTIAQLQGQLDQINEVLFEYQKIK